MFIWVLISTIFFLKDLPLIIIVVAGSLILLNLNFPYFLSSYSLMYMRNFYRRFIVILTFIIVSFIGLVHIRSNKHNLYIFQFVILISLIPIFIVFSTSRALIFFFSFEVSLIPIFFLILGWGGSPEKLQSGIYIIFYTLSTSLPFILLLICNLKWYSFIFYTFSPPIILPRPMERVTFIFTILVFLVKLPIFSLHLWLPKAHVEAPVVGSIILAGVLLKLGGFGLVQFVPSYFTNLFFPNVLQSISLIGAILTSLICLKQTDLKMLIAYSSVAHISLVLGGLVRNLYWPYVGSLYLMLGHGLASSCLFFLLNLRYIFSNRRSIILNKGLIVSSPLFTLFWFLSCAGNISNPFRLSFFGELFLIVGIFSFSISNFILFILNFLLVSTYSLHLFTTLSHGAPTRTYQFRLPLSHVETLVCLGHIFPLNILFLLI